jgi:hypothetical protein
LSRPILTDQIEEIHEAPLNVIHATIDGEVTSYFEWMGAGHYRADHRSGSMHGERELVRDVYYGTDGENLFLRLDLASGAEFAEIELRTEVKSIALLSDPAVESGRGRIFEARIPFSALSLTAADRLRFQIELIGEVLPLDLVPPQGWIEASLS